MRTSTTGPVSSAVFMTSVPGSPKAIGTLVARVTYDVIAGRLVPSRNQAPISTSDRIVGGQLFASDQVYPKKNVDLVIIGDAVAPDGKAVDRLDVEISIGELSRKLFVTGDRCWQRTDGKEEKPQSAAPASSIAAVMALVEKAKASAPATPPEFKLPDPPASSDGDEDKDSEEDAKKKEDKNYAPTEPSRFKRMRMDWAHAFGGESFQDNPIGKGFVTYPPDGKGDPAVAGVPLPNVEDSRRPVKSWKEWPAPSGCGYYPQRWGVRMRLGIEPRGIKVPCVTAAYFNQAHPDFEMNAFPGGKELVVTNMSPKGTFKAIVHAPLVTAALRLPGMPPQQLDLVWDLVCARPEYGEVSIVGRIPFRHDPISEAEAVVHVVSLEKPLEGF